MAYWPTRPSDTVVSGRTRCASEVCQAIRQSRVRRARGEHPERREPPELDREQQEQRHAEQEVRRRVEDQRQRVADEVHRPAAPPAGIRPQCETEADGDHLAQAEQDDGRPDPLRQHVDDGLAPGDERVAQIALGGGTDEGNELVREHRGVKAPPFTGRLDLGAGDVRRAPQQDAFRRSGHRPEQDEVDDDDHAIVTTAPPTRRSRYEVPTASAAIRGWSLVLDHGPASPHRDQSDRHDGDEGDESEDQRQTRVGCRPRRRRRSRTGSGGSPALAEGGGATSRSVSFVYPNDPYPKSGVPPSFGWFVQPPNLSVRYAWSSAS